MKHTVTVLIGIFLISALRLSAQELETKEKFHLLRFPPEKYKDVPLILGVKHKPGNCAYSPGNAYVDTSSVNAYFRQLAQLLNPDSVILVLESPMDTTVVYINTSNSVWITPEMEEMGFTQWIAADVRTSSVSSYMDAYAFLVNTANTYFSPKKQIHKTDYFGFKKISFVSKPIPDEVRDTVATLLPYLYETRAFENNLLLLSGLAQAKGYTTVIVTGYSHALALQKPCYVALPAVQESYEAIYTVDIHNQQLDMLLNSVEGHK